MKALEYLNKTNVDVFQGYDLKERGVRFAAKLGYSIKQLIGRGTFGLVFEASNNRVLKIISKREQSNINELKLVGNFDHENVVKVSLLHLVRNVLTKYLNMRTFN